MHIAWARHMLDNRELVVGGGTQPSTEPVRAGGLDGSAAAEERDNFHRDAHMNDRNHASLGTYSTIRSVPELTDGQRPLSI